MRPDRHARSVPPKKNALERLYVYWIVSTVLLAFLAIAPALLIHGELRRETEALERRISALESAAEIGPREFDPGGAAPARDDPGGEGPAAPDGPAFLSSSQPAAARPAPESRGASINRRLAEVLRGSPLGFPEIVDVAAAIALVDAGQAGLTVESWPEPVWAQLATAAELLGRSAAADRFAEKAGSSAATVVFLSVACRLRLARGELTAAARCAERLADQTGAGAESQVLLAQIELLERRPTESDQRLADLPPNASLRAADRLRLGRLLVEHERWEALEGLLEHVREVPLALVPQRDFLLGVLAAHRGRTIEALSLLDAARASTSAPAAASRDAASAETVSAGLYGSAPTRYELTVWRGVALQRDGQISAARALFTEATRLDPGQPNGWYRQAVLEVSAGDPDAAEEMLSKSLATAADHAPSWELLAVLALSRDDMAAAIERARRSVACHARRASAHFVLAIALARAGEEGAAKSLRTAIALDPSLRVQAGEAEILAELLPGLEASADSEDDGDG